jgi:hypothetical protein
MSARKSPMPQATWKRRATSGTDLHVDVFEGANCCVAWGVMGREDAGGVLVERWELAIRSREEPAGPARRQATLVDLCRVCLPDEGDELAADWRELSELAADAAAESGEPRPRR